MVSIFSKNRLTRIEVTCNGIIGYELLTPKECVELATKLLERYIEVMKA